MASFFRHSRRTTYQNKINWYKVHYYIKEQLTSSSNIYSLLWATDPALGLSYHFFLVGSSHSFRNKTPALLFYAAAYYGNGKKDISKKLIPYIQNTTCSSTGIINTTTLQTYGIWLHGSAVILFILQCQFVESFYCMQQTDSYISQCWL